MSHRSGYDRVLDAGSIWIMTGAPRAKFDHEHEGYASVCSGMSFVILQVSEKLHNQNPTIRRNQRKIPMLLL